MSQEETRILVVDDESTIREMLRLSLSSRNGFKVETAASGSDGLNKTASFHPHLIVLDLGLPDMDGFEVLKRLRQWTSIPILILTVTDDETTKVRLLDVGADDYLTKPFSLPELMARIRVGLRNRRAIEATPVFHSGNLHVDLSSGSVKLRGEDVKLTNTEFEILKHLVREQGKVVAQKQLLVGVWGAAAVDQSHYLRIYIAQLRKKIETDPSSPQHILTEPGVGYRLI